MRILIFGATGMLGHKLYQEAKLRGHTVFGTIRQSFARFSKLGLFEAEAILEGIDVRDEPPVREAIRKVNPQIVVNCAGIVKPLTTDAIETIDVNALFPHVLARMCSSARAKLIHISTDCVFSGNQGNYSESSIPDPVDLYGRSKLLGEVTYGNHLTIRTSLVGRELGTRRNLIEWFLNQKGEVKGFTLAVFSGLSTKAFSRLILDLAAAEVNGLIHVASEATTKFEVLQLAKDSFGLDRVSIVPDPSVKIDRSLAARRLAELGFEVPQMKAMMDEMAAENSFYERVSRTERT